MEDLFRSVGGVAVAEGGSPDPTWSFGWVPPHWRDQEQADAAEAAVRSMTPFSLAGKVDDDIVRTFNGKLWHRAEVKSALGFAYTGTHQKTGSCVGAGAGNAVNTLNFIEVLLLGQPEQIFLCFYPYHYGRGRWHGGMRRRGEGSFGSAQAKAIREDGVAYNSDPGLPQPVSTSDGIVWGSRVEMDWSHGGAADPLAYLPTGKKHLVTDVAQCRSGDEVRQALIAGKTVTCASMYAFRARVEGEGADAVLLGRQQGRWAHQMFILDFWRHPRFGPLYWLHNQWGLNAHGTCPSGQPLGGAWITEKDLDWICRDEVFAFFGHNGRAVPEIDWSLL